MFYVLMVNNHAKLKQIQRHVDLKHSIHGMLTTEPTIYHHQAGGKQQQLVAGLPDFVLSLSMQRVTTTLHSAFPPCPPPPQTLSASVWVLNGNKEIN